MHDGQRASSDNVRALRILPLSESINLRPDDRDAWRDARQWAGCFASNDELRSFVHALREADPVAEGYSPAVSAAIVQFHRRSGKPVPEVISGFYAIAFREAALLTWDEIEAEWRADRPIDMDAMLSAN